MPSDTPLTVMHLAPGHWAGHMRIYHRECMTLLEAGYKVELIAHRLPQEQLDTRLRLHSLGVYGAPSLAWRMLQRARRNQRAYALSRHANVALYHYHSPEFIAWGRRLRRLSGRPVIFDCMEDFEGYMRQRRGVPTILRGPLTEIVRRQLHAAARSCDAVIVADQGTAKLLRPYARRLLVLHNFPQLSLFPAPCPPLTHQPFDVVYHGTVPKYHLEVCLAVDKLLVERGYHIHWRFIGEVSEQDWLTGELTHRGIQARFHISGLIPHNQIAQEISRAKIGIIPLPSLPKFHNNIPQKLFEFMALGMPVVLSDLPPSRPFVGDGVCAFMVPPKDYGAYADAIIRLLNNPTLRRQMGAEGQRRIEQEYNWEKESQKLIDLYRELLGT